MSSLVLSYCRFHVLRLLRAQPRVFAALLISFTFLAASSLAYLQERHSARTAERQLGELRARGTHAEVAGLQDNSVLQPSLGLPPFHSAQLVNTLNQVATDSGLALDEVSYALADNANQPYLRYRMTLTVSASYPVIRHFSDQMSASLSHVSLDTISCMRDDIGVAELTCDLAFSAFFRKDGHG